MKKVFTVGVYDTLHIGHILLFKRAKELSDYLIVAVQEDDVVKKYKPDASMIYSFSERLYMVSAIRYVDETMSYRDIDSIIDKVDFDVFAVGPDQKHAGFQKAMAWCKAHGKKVVVIPRTEGISSSLLREYAKYK